MVDLAVAVALVAVPMLAGWDVGSAPAMVPLISGVCIFLYSLLTHYRFGDHGVLSIEIHLVLDYFIAAILIASPWLFGFAEYVFLPHVVLGLSQSVVTMFSQGTPRGESVKDL